MKKVNLLGPEFLYRRIESNTIKILLVIIVIFLAYTAYLMYGIQQESKGLVIDPDIDSKITKLEESIVRLQEDIDTQVEYLTELKANYFPYKEIAEFFAKQTPENMIILAVFDQEETLIARGFAKEPRVINQIVNSLETNLEMEDVKITELVNKEDVHLFELQFKRKVDID